MQRLGLTARFLRQWSGYSTSIVVFPSIRRMYCTRTQNSIIPEAELVNVNHTSLSSSTRHDLVVPTSADKIQPLDLPSLFHHIENRTQFLKRTNSSVGDGSIIPEGAAVAYVRPQFTTNTLHVQATYEMLHELVGTSGSVVEHDCFAFANNNNTSMKKKHEEVRVVFCDTRMPSYNQTDYANHYLFVTVRYARHALNHFEKIWNPETTRVVLTLWRSPEADEFINDIRYKFRHVQCLDVEEEGVVVVVCANPAGSVLYQSVVTSIADRRSTQRHPYVRRGKSSSSSSCYKSSSRWHHDAQRVVKRYQRVGLVRPTNLTTTTNHHAGEEGGEGMMTTTATMSDSPHRLRRKMQDLTKDYYDLMSDGVKPKN
eukprot:PhF_6_TR31372/c0_g1_i4/m.45942